MVLAPECLADGLCDHSTGGTFARNGRRGACAGILDFQLFNPSETSGPDNGPHANQGSGRGSSSGYGPHANQGSGRGSGSGYGPYANQGSGGGSGSGYGPASGSSQSPIDSEEAPKVDENWIQNQRKILNEREQTLRKQAADLEATQKRLQQEQEKQIKDSKDAHEKFDAELDRQVKEFKAHKEKIHQEQTAQQRKLEANRKTLDEKTAYLASRESALEGFQAEHEKSPRKAPARANGAKQKIRGGETETERRKGDPREAERRTRAGRARIPRETEEARPEVF